MKVFGVIGWKNSGKTGLVERLVAEFTARGFSISTIKHAHHSFDVDQPGRDSYRHRQAGAKQVLLSARTRWALMTENRDAPEATFAELKTRLDPVDLVIVEGFKAEEMPMIEAHRAATGNGLIATNDRRVLAVASDAAPEVPVPVMALDDTAAIADFIAAHLGLTPPKPARTDDRSGDCFALPPGVDWVPVDTALAHLRDNLRPVAGVEELPVSNALGRVLAEPLIAARANPPTANSAVDGYGFAHDTITDETLPLVTGRAAPGAPFAGAVPAGAAIRILTGAALPAGVDTVALQENVQVTGTALHMPKPPRKGANTRKAGEDLKPGDRALAADHKMRAQDIALAVATGLDRATCYRPLRVAVLSTGDELTDPGGTPSETAIFDANGPMLSAMATGWNHVPVPLKRAPDSRDAIREALDRGAAEADVILTSGGASAGDEDHIAALLEEAGGLNLWRIAVKPGRPMALGHWQGKPVFGLPGNPVAAFVCAAIFVRPALSLLAGAGWTEPQGHMLPAAFTKSKKPGRREYLRARLNEAGQVEVFGSEGSGRISGLSWATGLCELPDGGAEIAPGTPVRFISFAELGI